MAELTSDVNGYRTHFVLSVSKYAWQLTQPFPFLITTLISAKSKSSSPAMTRSMPGKGRSRQSSFEFLTEFEAIKNWKHAEWYININIIKHGWSRQSSFEFLTEFEAIVRLEDRMKNTMCLIEFKGLGVLFQDFLLRN